jgi:hypothetical protein
MENLNELKVKINHINPNYLALCSDFLILYSRFEYALKEEGFLQSRPHAMASIDDFVLSIALVFNTDTSKDLKQAVGFILSDPPRKLMVSNEKLIWEKSLVDGDLVMQLPEYIRRIRNSLMHGAKFYGEIDTGSRNWQLISSSMVIIEHWINLNRNVKARFRLN